MIGEIALLIFALAVLAAVVGLLLGKINRLSTTVGQVAVTAEAVAVTTDAVNKAINNVPEGEPTLLERFNTMHASFDEFATNTIEWRGTVDGRLDRIEDHITRPPVTRRKSA